MNRIIAVILILLALFTPAQAAPTGQAFVAYASCAGSEVFWLAPTTGNLANTYASVIMDAEWHGNVYPVEMFYQYWGTLANGMAVYRAIDWQPFSLNAARVTITGGEIVGQGGMPLEPIIPGRQFVMGCAHVYMPAVMR